MRSYIMTCCIRVAQLCPLTSRTPPGCIPAPMARRYEDVMGGLVAAIVGGEYAEGSWLPAEVELAERFGASRGVLREALRGLEERGLVAVQPGRGHLVRQREDWDIRAPDVLLAAAAHGPEPRVLA